MTESEAKVILESEYKFHGECSVFGEALTIAINALEKQIPKKPIFQFNFSDTVSRFECKCGNIIKVRHDIGIMDNSDAPKFCDNCGHKLDWSDEVV